MPPTLMLLYYYLQGQTIHNHKAWGYCLLSSGGQSRASNTVTSNSPHASFIKKPPNEGDREDKDIIMGTFILIVIAVAVTYFIFQIADTSPVNKYYFNHTGILMIHSELSKIIDMMITVSIQDKYITINGDYCYKKNGNIKKKK